MSEVTLIYPFFKQPRDRSIFRFPPLGLGYIASNLRTNGIPVTIIDCTFSNEEDAVEKLRKLKSRIIGIYSMYTMEENSLKLAKLLRNNCELLVAGGPLPSSCPEKFTQDFDAVVIGEGEQTMLELVRSLDEGKAFSKIAGMVFRKELRNVIQNPEANNNSLIYTPPRQHIMNLDSIPFPTRDLFDNAAYQDYYKRGFGYTVTSIMTSRGCPFNCDFCSKPVFGDTFRAASAESVVNEIEDAISFGYERIFFQDDCFTLDRERVIKICDEIILRKLKIDWECLSRVDAIRPDTMSKMKQAGCKRIFFGIESGNDSILRIMNKRFTVNQARKAVELTASEGIKTGAFFIVGYPGETNETILNTIRFATSLTLEYLSFTLPYPIPGTGLYEKVKDCQKNPANRAKQHRLVDHTLTFESTFSEGKLKFAIVKAMLQFNAKKHLKPIYFLVRGPLEILTDNIFKALK